MALQGTLEPNHVPVNNYVLRTEGVSHFFSEISGIEEEIQAVDLPDRTKATGGNVLPKEFTAKTPLHHATTRAGLEAWYQEGQCPVSATYKKTGTLIHKDITSATNGQYSLSGLWIMKRKLPDLDKSNDGEVAMIEWTFSCDRISEI